MDHFAKPGDDLAVAQRQGGCTRNFQGYSSAGDSDIVGLGVSAISKVGPVYAQNVKTLDEYYARLESGEIPVMRGIELTSGRPGAARGDPGPGVPLRGVEGGDLDRPPDRLRALLRRRAGRIEGDGGGRRWSSSTTSGSPSRRGAGCWCARCAPCSTATCAPTASAAATRSSYERRLFDLRQTAPGTPQDDTGRVDRSEHHS